MSAQPSHRNPHSSPYIAALIASVDGGGVTPATEQNEARMLDGLRRKADGTIDRRAIACGKKRAARGAPCGGCGLPVPDESRYTSWCGEVCRDRAIRALDGLPERARGANRGMRRV